MELAKSVFELLILIHYFLRPGTTGMSHKPCLCSAGFEPRALFLTGKCLINWTKALIFPCHFYFNITTYLHQFAIIFCLDNWTSTTDITPIYIYEVENQTVILLCKLLVSAHCMVHRIELRPPYSSSALLLSHEGIQGLCEHASQPRVLIFTVLPAWVLYVC